MKIKNIICALLLTVSFAGCSDNDDNPPVEETPKRTVLVYMVASNLGSDLINNINSMISVATPTNLNGGNLLVLYSKNKEEAELIQIKQGDNEIVTRHHIRDYSGQSGISSTFMKNVIQDVIADFPAQSYGLVLSSHGTSWLPSEYTGMLRSFGEESGERMEIYDLAAGLPDNMFDFILFDACSMGGIECVFELKDKASYIISSPSEVLTQGFPYTEILPYMFTDEANVEQIAKDFYTYYNNNTSAPYGNVSVTKTSELDELASITREIIQSAGLEGMYALPLSNIQILSNLPSSPTALYDFDNLMENLATSDQYKQFQTILDKTITAKYATKVIYCTKQYNGSRYYPVNHFSGLSIYPLQEKLTELNTWYEQLEWYKAVYR